MKRTDTAREGSGSAPRERKLSQAMLAFMATFLVAGGIAAGGIAASQGAETVLPGHAKLGEVSIDLATSGNDDGRIDIGKDYERIWTIENHGKECYVRLNVHLTMGDLDIVAEHDPAENPDWICAEDGYWYLKEPLATGESARFAGKLYMPHESEWYASMQNGGDYQICQLSFAEAVQAAHLEPDFSADSPWGGIEPEATTATDKEA